MSAVERGAIFFLTGPPGVGKSTVARALADRSEKSIYFDIDLMRLRVVKGLSLPKPGAFSAKTREQFLLAHVATGRAAAMYADAGLDVVAEHCSHTEYIEAFIQAAGPTSVVSLFAKIESNLKRNLQRSSDSFDYAGLDFVIKMLSESMPPEHAEAGYQVLDTTQLSIEQTVDQIIQAQTIEPKDIEEACHKKRAPIFFLTGAPGVGKSTTGQALANRFRQSILFDIDYFRSLVVKGLKQPTTGWDEETETQFRLAHQSVGAIAKTYSEAGFAVIAEHCSSYDMVQEFLDYSEGGIVVCLRSEMETNLARNLLRTNKSFDPKDIEHFVLSLGDSLHIEFEKHQMMVLNNTNLPVEKAVEVILSLDPARVQPKG